VLWVPPPELAGVGVAAPAEAAGVGEAETAGDGELAAPARPGEDCVELAAVAT
jgi:hypothetical protein